MVDEARGAMNPDGCLDVFESHSRTGGSAVGDDEVDYF